MGLSPGLVKVKQGGVTLFAIRRSLLASCASYRPMNDYESALQGWMNKAKPKTQEADGDLFRAKDNAELADALARVRQWVRTRFSLPEDAAILVSEIACDLPGCPPLETAVAFWEGTNRHHFKLFKRASEVAPDDLPYAWMKESLILPEGFDCECC
jgi:hypothetical protein